MPEVDQCQALGWISALYTAELNSAVWVYSLVAHFVRVKDLTQGGLISQSLTVLLQQRPLVRWRPQAAQVCRCSINFMARPDGRHLSRYMHTAASEPGQVMLQADCLLVRSTEC